MGLKSHDNCPSLHMIFDRYRGVVEPEEASRECQSADSVKKGS
jgi:hypothetical protein